MDELKAQIAEQQKQLDAILKSVEKTQKYFRAVLWITIITLVIPLLALIFVVPFLLSSYTSSLGGLL